MERSRRAMARVVEKPHSLERPNLSAHDHESLGKSLDTELACVAPEYCSRRHRSPLTHFGRCAGGLDGAARTSCGRISWEFNALVQALGCTAVKVVQGLDEHRLASSNAWKKAGKLFPRIGENGPDPCKAWEAYRLTWACGLRSRPQCYGGRDSFHAAATMDSTRFIRSMRLVWREI